MKNLKLKLCMSFAILILGSATSANAAPFGFDLEPIVGYDMVKKYLPTEHSTSRLVYGGRLTLGFPLLAAEAEYTRGTDTETFSDLGLTTADTSDKAKVGLRSNFRLGRLFVLTMRGGVQASRTKSVYTLAGSSATTWTPVVYKPYAGAGLGIQLNRKTKITGGATVVFNDFPRMAYNEYQYTLGFVLSLP